MHESRMADEISATHRLKVRYGETDQMGVVYHANYIIWFHEGRDALLIAHGINVAALEQRGLRFPVVDAWCRYLRAARYGDEINVIAHLRRERVARMRFRFEIVHARNRRLLACGESVTVMTDISGKLMLRLPPDVETCLFAPPGDQGTPASIEEKI